MIILVLYTGDLDTKKLEGDLLLTVWFNNLIWIISDLYNWILNLWSYCWPTATVLEENPAAWIRECNQSSTSPSSTFQELPHSSSSIWLASQDLNLFHPPLHGFPIFLLHYLNICTAHPKNNSEKYKFGNFLGKGIATSLGMIFLATGPEVTHLGSSDWGASQLAIRALQTQSLVSCLLVMFYDVLCMMFYFSKSLPGILSFPVNKFQFKTHQKFVWLTVNNMCCIFSWWDSYGMLYLLSSFLFILWLHNL